MNLSVGDIIVIAVIVLVMVLAIRNLIKIKKSGGCSGNCGSCSCGCSPEEKNSNCHK